MTFNPFLNSERQLRNGWWILIFFLVLAGFLVPVLIAAQNINMEVSMGIQASIIVIASMICQLLRRKPIAELMGKFDIRWFKELSLGGLIGSALILIPALILGVFGWYTGDGIQKVFLSYQRVYCSLQGSHSQKNCYFADLSFNVSSLGWDSGQPN